MKQDEDIVKGIKYKREEIKKDKKFSIRKHDNDEETNIATKSKVSTWNYMKPNEKLSRNKILTDQNIIKIKRRTASNSSTEIKVGEKRSIRRKRAKKIYLPEHNDQGVGSFDLISFKKSRRKKSNKQNGTVFECITGSKEMEVLNKYSKIDTKFKTEFSKGEKLQSRTCNNKTIGIKIEKVTSKSKLCLNNSSSSIKNITINSKERKPKNNVTFATNQGIGSMQSIPNIHKITKSKSSNIVSPIDIENMKTFPEKSSITSTLQQKFEVLRGDISKDNIKRECDDQQLLFFKSESEIIIKNESIASFVDKNSPVNSEQSNECLNNDTENKLYNEGVMGMFKLWNQKFNFESDDAKLFSDNAVDNDINKIDKQKPKIKHKKFMLFRKKLKNKNIIAGRCQVNNECVLNVHNNNVDTHNVTKEKNSEGNHLNNNFYSWIQIFKSKPIQSKKDVKIRWNNKLFTKSSSTVFEIIDALYNNKNFKSNSKISNIYKSSHKKSLIVNNCNIQAWMLQKTILDNSNFMKSLKTSYGSNLNECNKKHFIEQSKAFSNKIEIILQTAKFIRDTNKKNYKSHLNINISKGLLLSNDNNIIGEEIINKIVDYDVFTPKKRIIINKKNNCLQKSITKIKSSKQKNSEFCNIDIKKQRYEIVGNDQISLQATSDYTSQYTLCRIEKRSKLAETFLQDYLRQLLNLDQNIASLSASDLSTNVDKSYSNINESDTRLYSLSSCNVYHTEEENKKDCARFLKKFKFSKSNELEEARTLEMKRIYPKDSLEVYKRRKLYAISKHASQNEESESGDNKKIKPMWINKSKKNKSSRKKEIVFIEPFPKEETSRQCLKLCSSPCSMKSIKKSSDSKVSCNKLKDPLNLSLNHLPHETVVIKCKSPTKLPPIQSKIQQKSLTNIKDVCSNISFEIICNEPKCPSKHSLCSICQEDSKCKIKHIKKGKPNKLISDTKQIHNKTNRPLPPVPPGSSENIECFPPWPVNSNTSNQDNLNRLLKEISSSIPICPPCNPIGNLSNGLLPHIELIRRKSICPTPKLSKICCQKDTSQIELSKCSSICRENYEIPLPYTPGVNPEKQRQTRKDFDHKELESNETLRKTEIPNTNTKKQVKNNVICECGKDMPIQKKSNRTSKEITKQTKEIKNESEEKLAKLSKTSVSKAQKDAICEDCCKKRMENIKPSTYCPKCRYIIVQPGKTTGCLGIKLQCTVSNQKCSTNKCKRCSNNAIVLNSCNIEGETPGQAEPCQSLSIDRYKNNDNLILQSSTSRFSKERELSIINDVYKSQTNIDKYDTKINNKVSLNKGNFKKIEKSKSKSSLSNIVEIQFKLKIKKGDKYTEVKVIDDKSKHKENALGNNISKFPKICAETSVSNDTDSKQTNDDIIKKDVNVEICIQNNKYKQNITKSNNINLKRNKYSESNEMYKQFSGELQTDSTNYCDQHDKNLVSNVTVDPKFSVHRATVDLLNSPDTTETLSSTRTSSKAHSQTSFTCTVISSSTIANVNSSKEEIDLGDDCNNITKVTTNDLRQYQEINNNIKSIRRISNKISEINVKNVLTTSDAKRRKINLEEPDTTENQKHFHTTKQGKKDALKNLMIKSNKLQHNDLNVKMVRNALKEIFTSSGSRITFTNNKKKSYDSGSYMNKCQPPGICLCNVLPSRLNKFNDSKTACCCANTRTLNDNNNCDNRKNLYSNKNIQASMESEIILHNSKKNNINKQETVLIYPMDSNYSKNFTNTNNMGHIDSQVFRAQAKCKLKNYEDKAKSKKQNCSNCEYDKPTNIYAADILQSSEVKKAVISIYSEKSLPDNNVLANLPNLININMFMDSSSGSYIVR